MAGPPPDPPDAVLLARIALIPDPAATSSDLLPHVDKSRNALNKQLNRLVREGKLKTKSAGEAARVYWLTDVGREEIDAASLEIALQQDRSSPESQ